MIWQENFESFIENLLYDNLKQKIYQKKLCTHVASFWGEIVKSVQESSLLKGNAVKINMVQMELLWKYWLMVKSNKIMIEETEIYAFILTTREVNESTRKIAI